MSLLRIPYFSIIKNAFFYPVEETLVDLQGHVSHQCLSAWVVQQSALLTTFFNLFVHFCAQKKYFSALRFYFVKELVFWPSVSTDCLVDNKWRDRIEKGFERIT